MVADIIPLLAPSNSSRPSATPTDVDSLSPSLVPSNSQIPSVTPSYVQSLAPSATPISPEDCSDLLVIDFETAGNGTRLQGGDYVRDDWAAAFGFYVDIFPTVGGFAPNNSARIFNTSDPIGDFDLGSPHRQCEGGGPGIGVGGRPNSPGENCKPQGNVLIIQETDKENPDDNLGGGIMCFVFESPVDLYAIGLVRCTYALLVKVLYVRRTKRMAIMIPTDVGVPSKDFPKKRPRAPPTAAELTRARPMDPCLTVVDI